VRLKVFERDNWKCRNDKCQSPEHTPLAVHHKSYVAGRDPWDYPPTNLVTYCEQCHDLVHALPATPAGPLREGHVYDLPTLTKKLGFRPEKYLTLRSGRIVSVRVTLDYNPDAPAILLPGDTEEIITNSELFAGQTNFIPVFLKAMEAGWKYCGRWRVETVTTNPAEIALHQRVRKLQGIPISMVLFLEKEPPLSRSTPSNPPL